MRFHALFSKEKYLDFEAAVKLLYKSLILTVSELPAKFYQLITNYFFFASAFVVLY
jgi:hypothetical protein